MRKCIENEHGEIVPAPPLPIRAPGHGQGTEEERVERDEFEKDATRVCGNCKHLGDKSSGYIFCKKFGKYMCPFLTEQPCMVFDAAAAAVPVYTTFPPLPLPPSPCACGEDHTVDAAAAAAVPVPAVEWTTERMKNLGVCHNGQADAIVDGASGTCALWPSQEMDGLPCMSCSYFEDARLRIEPPVTKGEGGK